MGVRGTPRAPTPLNEPPRAAPVIKNRMGT
jgi:hypothetical protein